MSGSRSRVRARRAHPDGTFPCTHDDLPDVSESPAPDPPDAAPAGVAGRAALGARPDHGDALADRQSRPASWPRGACPDAFQDRPRDVGRAPFDAATHTGAGPA